MPIIVLPKTLTAHTDAVASAVMADFNKLLELVNGQLDAENITAATRQRLFDPGDLKLTARAAPPEGWLLCDGSAVSRSTYADLFAAIGITYGPGNGTTTFNLPDYRGRTLVGVDGAAGRLSANDALGNSGGSEKHALSTAELAAHHHRVAGKTLGPDVNHFHNLPIFAQLRHEGSGFAYTGMSSGGNTVSGTETASHAHSIDIESQDTGAGSGHNNMQPFQVCNVLIKT